MARCEDLSKDELIRRLPEAEAATRAWNADREKLRQSEERLRLLLDHSPTVAWIKDAAGRFVYLSKTFEQRLGVRLDDWYGKTDTEVWPPATAEAFRKNDPEVLVRDRPMEFVDETVSTDGSRCYWLTVKFPVRDAEGRPMVAGTGLDVTDRRRAEEEARQRLARRPGAARPWNAPARRLPSLPAHSRGGLGKRPDCRRPDRLVAGWRSPPDRSSGIRRPPRQTGGTPAALLDIVAKTRES